ncbi:Predicted metal-dependent hydrolase of the TIM-barrel fold [Chlamydia abortus]|nr:Predicted metal-dependent hydrolase of the TIM-barrel fold [Chlamydia abortus]
MIIDVHNHPDWYGYNLERFLDNMKQYNIDKTWLLSWECPATEYNPEYIKHIPDPDKPNGPISFERCAAYKEQAPDKFILGYAPDPRLPDAIDKLDHAIRLYDVKVYGELKLRMMYDNPDALRLYRFCGEKGLPVLVHIDYEFDTGFTYPRPNWWYGGGIGAFERAVQACPETVFIGHAPGFWAHISGDDQYNKTAYPTGPVLPGGRVSEMLRSYPNLYCDISAGSGCNALARDREFAKQFLKEFQDRIMYGRDYFDNVHQQLLESLDLPKTVLDKIYYQNALKLIPE